MLIENEYESCRSSFRPDVVRVLLIGESRPQNGTFFYNGDSRLTQYTREAFSIEYGEYPDTSSFLSFFKNVGCYLVDLCMEPINGLTNHVRNMACIEGEPMLAATLLELQPQAIIVVKKSISRSVHRAINRASLSAIPVFQLPFPAQGHERKYVQNLASALVTLRKDGLLADYYSQSCKP